ncbi:TonB-dependent receptor [Flavobacterium gilvum]|uniref:TonB-dependent receptor n=1 Tax=Flavobacterium gilvum TaxID=1492737 RepID=A0AAC9I5Y3_9FLAO|nr:TonB-dependent receptor [Flavobacterium gilvum]AOW08507.1 TonB-dependent receptor [Flavobacterium gilvum]KFC58224.1 TonB-denpendent receptor [Flavobacterium gilvum]
MKRYIVALLVGITTFLQAQNSITGKVTDSKNNPLAGVIVDASELHKSTKTDVNGNYTLRELPNGGLTLVFSSIGFETQSKKIEKAQNTHTLDVVMAELAFQMDEVIVSTPFSKLQSQNVMKIDRESVKTMQEKGSATLIEGLATIPGVSQVSTGTSIGKPVIRGLSGNRVLVYTQGIRLENQQFGDEHGLGLNDSGVENVEVIKGPASLLYGSDALGGVLFFNPEKFALANTFQGDFGQRLFSNTLGASTTLGLKTSTDNWKYLIRGAYNTQSDYKIPDGDRVTNTRFQEMDFKAGIGYSNAKFSSILRYNYNNLDVGIPEDGIADQTTSKKTTFPKQGVFNNLLSLNNTLFFSDSKLDINLGYIRNDRSEFEDSNIAVLHMILNTFDYNVKYYLPKLGKVETIVGVQGMSQENKNLADEFLIPNATTNDFGVFGTGIYNWDESSLQGGLRFDYRNLVSEEHGVVGTEGYFSALNKNYDSFNASLGYKTNFAKDLSFRLNTATGFRAPNLAELSSNGVHEGTFRYEIGNPDLKTEQNLQTDLDLEYKSTHFEFSVSGFYNHINDYIYSSPTGEELDGFKVYDYIQNNANLYGGEVALHIHPHPLDWLHFETSFENVTGKLQDGGYLPQIPANNWDNTIRTNFKLGNWIEDAFATLNVSTTFAQKKVSGFDIPSDGYTLLNMGFGGKVKLGKIAFDLNLNGNNLLNKTYIPHLSRLATSGIPNLGRNFVLGAAFKF